MCPNIKAVGAIHSRSAGFKLSYPILFCLLVVLFAQSVSALPLQVENGTTEQYRNDATSADFSGAYANAIKVNFSQNVSGYVNFSTRYRYSTGASDCIRIMKNGVMIGVETCNSGDAVHFVNQTISGTFNTTDSIWYQGKDNTAATGSIFNTVTTFDYVDAPVIISPVNNSAQTSRNVNITWSGYSGNVQYQALDQSCSVAYIDGNSSTNYSGDKTLNVGTSCIRIRGLNAGINTTAWTQIQVDTGVYQLGGVGYNWSANASSQNYTAIDQGTNYLWPGTIYRDNFNDNVMRGTQVTPSAMDWSIDAGKLRYNGTTTYSSFIRFNSSTNISDSNILIYVKNVQNPIANAITLRYDEYSNLYQFRMQDTPNARIYAYLPTLKTITTANSSYWPDLNTATYFNAYIYGADMGVRYWNYSDNEIPSWTTNATNTSITTGQFGLSAIGVYSDVLFDNFWVRPVNSDSNPIANGDYITKIYDFGNNSSILAVKLATEQNWNNITVNISTSSDNSSWSNFHTLKANANNDTKYYVASTDRKRYAKIAFVWNNGSYISNNPLIEAKIYTHYGNVSIKKKNKVIII